MTRRVLGLAYLIAVLTTGSAAQSPPESPVPGNDEIRKILVERIDVQRQSIGIVAGVIDAGGRRIVAYGAPRNADSRSLNGDSIFEIGSATKVFTALLLADMAQRGEVALTDPVAKYLPEGVNVPERNGKAITLRDLANHTSGLPRLPANLRPKDPSNPYADYTVAQLYEFLSSHELGRDPGAEHEYSNLGAGLLGHALALRAGTDYETLVQSRICKPLGMASTSITLSAERKGRLVEGHDASLKPVPNWDIPTLAGAGALRSSASDMLSFLAAVLGYEESPLAPAMKAMLEARWPAGSPGLEIGLGWLALTREGEEIVWHNGGTGGYRSFVGYNPRTRAGVVILSNTFTAAGVDDIGLHLLNPKLPLMPPPKERKAVTIDPALLERYVGTYQLAPNFILTVTREGDSLFVQATLQPKNEVFPESERDFFFKVVDAQITFEADGEGPASQLILHQAGRHVPAKRIE